MESSYITFYEINPFVCDVTCDGGWDDLQAPR